MTALQNISLPNLLSISCLPHPKFVHDICCIPSVMVEVMYAGVNRAAGLLRETGIRFVWTLKN